MGHSATSISKPVTHNAGVGVTEAGERQGICRGVNFDMADGRID